MYLYLPAKAMGNLHSLERRRTETRRSWTS